MLDLLGDEMLALLGDKMFALLGDEMLACLGDEMLALLGDKMLDLLATYFGAITKREIHKGNAHCSTTGVLLTKPLITCAVAFFPVQSIAFTQGYFLFPAAYSGCNS